MDKRAQMRGQAIGLISMLGAQFILGMILNSFVSLSRTHPGTTGGYVTRSVHGFGWAISDGGGFILLLHVLVAIGLLLGSISLLLRAVFAKDRPWIIASVIGFLGVLAALTNGLAFLGYNKDANSFVMAMGFFAAATAYSTVVSFEFRTARSERKFNQSAATEDETAHAQHRLRTSHS